MSARPHLPETSIAAYHSSADMRVRQRSLIYAALSERGFSGYTCEELSFALGGKLSSVQINREIGKMEADTLVYHEGTRRNHAGRNMRVWFAEPTQYAIG